MPKEVVINAWCDPCYREGEHTPAEEVTAALGDLARMRPQGLLLCERHRKEFYEPLRELLEEFGAQVGDAPTPVKKTRAKARRGSNYGPFPAGEWECPLPDCDATDLKDKTAVQRHTRMIHGVMLGDVLAESTGAAPAPSAAPVEPRKPTADMPLRNIPEQGVKMFCPVEGCNLAEKPSKNKRSLAVHFSQRHGIPIAEWFRQHPDVDPESLMVPGDDTLI